MKNGIDPTLTDHLTDPKTKEYLMYVAYPGTKILLTLTGQPLYRIMAEQQVLGLGVFKTIRHIAQHGPKAFFYGLSPMMLKEGQKALVQMIPLRNAENWTSTFLSQYAPYLVDSKTANAVISGSMLAIFEWGLGTPFGRYATWASSQEKKVYFRGFCQELYRANYHKPPLNQITGIINEAYKAGGVNLAKQWVAAITIFGTNLYMHHHLDPFRQAYPHSVAWGETVIPALLATLTSITLEGIKTRMQNKTGKKAGLKEQLTQLFTNPKNAFKGLLPKSILVLIGNIMTVGFLNESRALKNENNKPPAVPPTPSPSQASSPVNSLPNSPQDKGVNVMELLCDRMQALNFLCVSKLSIEAMLMTKTPFRFCSAKPQVPLEIQAERTDQVKCAKLCV